MKTVSMKQVSPNAIVTNDDVANNFERMNPGLTCVEVSRQAGEGKVLIGKINHGKPGHLYETKLYGKVFATN